MIVVRVVQQQAATVIGIALPRGMAATVHHRGKRIHHVAQNQPERRRKRPADRLTLDRGGEREFENEAVVFGRELAVQSARKRLPFEFPGEDPGRCGAPIFRLGKQRKSTRRDKLAGGFRDHVVVGGRVPAVQGMQVLLMAIELCLKDGIMLEQIRGARPGLQKAAAPHPGYQSYAKLDSADPMRTRKKGIGLPPVAQIARHPVGVSCVARERVGSRQNRQMVMTRRLPDIFEIADARRIAMRIPKSENRLGCANPGGGIEKPVRLGKVGAIYRKDRPSAVQYRIGRGDERGLTLRAYGEWLSQRHGRARRDTREVQRIDLAPPQLEASPSELDRTIACPADDFAGRHVRQAPQVPTQLHFRMRPSMPAQRPRWEDSAPPA